MSIFKEYIKLYPQLSLEIKVGQSTSDEYTGIVKKGSVPECLPDRFTGSERDSIQSYTTPAGRVDVLHFGLREDFVRFCRSMVFRCEPAEIPDSMGAITVSGVVNWDKLRRHKAQWLNEHSVLGWKEEFKRFTSEPANYKDVIAAVTDGPYSAVPAEAAGFEPEDWFNSSLTIRTMHELTHVVCRALWPGNKHAVRDEIIADCIGLICAFGEYDPVLALRLLGISSTDYIKGGRLENYTGGIAADKELISKVRQQVGYCSAFLGSSGCSDPMEFLTRLETGKIGLEIWK